MRLIPALLALLVPALAFAQQPTIAPSHQYFGGPSLGMVYTGLCTVTGATPVTCNATKGAVTTSTLTTAGATTTTYTVNNTFVTANSIMTCDVGAYSGTYGTAGLPAVASCTPGAGSFVITIANAHGSNALNGTLTIHFEILD